jgi:(4-alkanoyl-5-oxo-2,5-dihydrofuran-3-yl)methyl phosphate reductase
MTRRVLVTGATGVVGRHLAARLAAAGVEVHALCRDPARAAGVLPEGVRIAPGDLTDARSVADALRGVDRAFVVLTDDDGAAFAEAVRANDPPEHLVVLSANAPDDPATTNPLFRKHVLGESRLRDTGVPLTVLRSGPFASLALGWAPSIRAAGVVGAVHPELAVPVVDPRDIAEVARVVLLGAPTEHVAEPLTLSGPEVLDTHDRVRILGEVLGRALVVRTLDEDQWVRAVSGRLPESYARALLEVERHLLALRPPVTTTVPRLTGVPARTFHGWATEHAAAFRG